VPVALWRHFPNDDLRAEGLAARVVEFQKKYDFDFVKVTPASGYPAEMYGASFIDGKNREGTRSYTKRPVNRLDDWGLIEPLDATNPVFVRETTALKQIRQQLGPDVPVLQTIFGPLNSAHNLAGDRTFGNLRARPDIVERALRAITQTTIRLAVASLRSGADAIFFATQMATPKYLTLDEFKKYSEPYDLQVIEAIRAEKPDFIFLHIHGLDIYFDALARWPVDVINWHDRRTPPSLREASAKFKGALAGGLEEWKTLADGSPEDARAQALDAIGQMNRQRFILAAGCVIPVDTPDANIRAAVQAAAG
jgi:uroporphyrinogen decarboxylase